MMEKYGQGNRESYVAVFENGEKVHSLTFEEATDLMEKNASIRIEVDLDDSE